jgi:hypothetical protein
MKIATQTQRQIVAHATFSQCLTAGVWAASLIADARVKQTLVRACHNWEKSLNTPYNVPPNGSIDVIDTDIATPHKHTFLSQ